MQDIFRGDILLFRRNPKDKVSGFLSWVLQKFEPGYNREYWHTAPVTRVTEHGCYVLDACRDGIRENFYSYAYIEAVCKIYHWLDSVPSKVDMGVIVKELYGAAYDRGAYVGTVFFYLVNRIFNKQYRIHDREYTCWEVISYVTRALGKPLQPLYQYPIISSIERLLELDAAKRTPPKVFILQQNLEGGKQVHHFR